MTIVIEHPNCFGVVSEPRLLALEKRLVLPLPSDYREFLLNNNGGNPVPSGFWIVEGLDGSQVQEFYGLHDGPDWLQLDRYSNAARGIPGWLLAIGEDGLGDLLCLGVLQDNHGRIFFVDHEVHPFNRPEAVEGITKIADSFSEFMAGLRKLPP